MKLSKRAKMQLKFTNSAEQKAIFKAARLLFDFDCITAARVTAIVRTLGINKAPKFK